MKDKFLIIILIINIIVGLFMLLPGIIIYSCYNSKDSTYSIIDGKIRFQPQNLGFNKKVFSYVKIDISSDNPFLQSMPGVITSMPDIKNNSCNLVARSSFFKDSYILESKYNLSNEEWGGLWIRFVSDGYIGHECDFSQFNYLIFYTRAISNDKNPKLFRVELKTGKELKVNMFLIPEDTTTPNKPIADTWQKYILDIRKLKSADLKSLKEICIVYIQDYIIKTNGSFTGTLYFDGFEFVK